jgi:hypothetical protein
MRLNLRDLVALSGVLVNDYGPATGEANSWIEQMRQTEKGADTYLKMKLLAAQEQIAPSYKGPGVERTTYASTMTDQLDTMYMLARWATYGFNVFDVSHGLAAALLMTDPVKSSEFMDQMPFPIFVLQLQPGILPFFYGGSKDNHGWVSWIWVHRFLARHPNETVDRDVFRWSPEDAETGLRLFANRGPGTMDSEEIWQKGVAPMGTLELVPEDDITLRAAGHLVRNFITYLNSTGGMATRKPSNAKAIARKRPGESWPTHWMIGQEVKINRQLREATLDALTSGTRYSREGWQVRVRHIVRGHMKSQPYGLGRKDRKVIWVQPYWRGPEGAEAWAHLYTAK